MISRVEMHIGYAVFELLSQKRSVSTFAILDILKRKLQKSEYSECERIAILNAIKEVKKHI